MCKFFYKLAVEHEARSYRIQIDFLISKITECNAWMPSSDVKDGTFENPEGVFYKTIKGEKTVYDMFFKCVHVHVSLSENEKIYSIRLKMTDENWNILNHDFSHPTNKCLEVFVAYRVPVLDITYACGDVYNHGNWDKYVYKTMYELNHAVEMKTTSWQFNDYYKK